MQAFCTAATGLGSALSGFWHFVINAFASLLEKGAPFHLDYLLVSFLTLAAAYIVLSQCFHQFVGRMSSFSSYSSITWVMRLRNFLGTVLFLGDAYRRKTLVEFVFGITIAVSGLVSTFGLLAANWPVICTEGVDLAAQSLWWQVLSFLALIVGAGFTIHSLSFYRSPHTYADARLAPVLGRKNGEHIDFGTRFTGNPFPVRDGQEIKDMVFVDEPFSAYLLGHAGPQKLPFDLPGRGWYNFWRQPDVTRRILVKEPLRLPLQDAMIVHRNDRSEKKIVFTNENKIRLSSLERGADGGYRARVEKTCYYLSEITNKLFSRAFVVTDEQREDAPPIITFDFRKGLEHHAFSRSDDILTLLDFDKTPRLSNHIGGTMLAVSADGYPIFCNQLNANENPDSVASAGSGSIDYEDIRRATPLFRRGETDLIKVIRHGMARELLEETGAVLQHSYRRSDHRRIRDYAPNIEVAGYYRPLSWSGLPIFVGFARHFQTYGDICNNFGRRACLLQDFEVEMWDYMELDEWRANPFDPIRSADDMILFISDFLLPVATKNGLKVADQIRLLAELLRTSPSMRAHFDSAMLRKVALGGKKRQKRAGNHNSRR